MHRLRIIGGSGDGSRLCSLLAKGDNPKAFWSVAHNRGAAPCSLPKQKREPSRTSVVQRQCMGDPTAMTSALITGWLRAGRTSRARLAAG